MGDCCGGVGDVGVLLARVVLVLRVELGICV